MVQRQVVRSNYTYRTRSNKQVKVKTPGGRLIFQVQKKRGKIPKCGSCNVRLQGIVPKRPAAFSRLKKRDRKVSRSHGGSICGNCLKDKIISTFLKEEEARVAAINAAEEQ
ncbi:60S ribosomal protein L34 [Dictyocoela muelleri]|nr:60S ribosomal protein L34 [Dictyocoela muelleri]